MTKNLLRTVCLMLDVAVKIDKKRSGHFPPAPPYPSSTEYNLELKSKPWAGLCLQSWHNETEQPLCLPLRVSQLKRKHKNKWLLRFGARFQGCHSFRLVQDASVLEKGYFWMDGWLALSSYWKKIQLCWAKKHCPYIFSLDTCIPHKRNHGLLVVKSLRMKRKR